MNQVNSSECFPSVCINKHSHSSHCLYIQADLLRFYFCFLKRIKGTELEQPTSFSSNLGPLQSMPSGTVFFTFTLLFLFPILNVKAIISSLLLDSILSQMLQIV